MGTVLKYNRQEKEAVDNYPFDREHWSVDVSFPIKYIDQKQHLYGIANTLSGKYGGTMEMMCEPMKEFIGKDGYKDFGASFVFEAHDQNTYSFIEAIKATLIGFSVETEFNPTEILNPEEAEIISFKKNK